MEKSENIHFTDQLFVTGYSQGGHSAMADARSVQESTEMVD
ncbi:MAG: hypothetical protein R2771_14000 [Saprospiraceae bacterium]